MMVIVRRHVQVEAPRYYLHWSIHQETPKSQSVREEKSYNTAGINNVVMKEKFSINSLKNVAL